MSEPHYAFDPKWFQKHQYPILWCLNKPIIRHIARWIMRIDCKDTINKITPNSYTFGAQKKGKKLELKTDFRTHNKYSKRMYHAFSPVWWIMHFWDWLVADRFIPILSCGFSTLTVYPDADWWATTDWSVARASTDQTLANIIAWAGTNAYPTSTDNWAWSLLCSTTTNQFSAMRRAIFTLDTSSLTAAASISSVVFSLYGSFKSNGIGSDNLHICSATPSSNNTLVSADYWQLGSTSFANISYASFSTAWYNDLTLDANGIANVSKTWISKFGSRLWWDINGSFTGTWSSWQITQIHCFFADNTGTSQDPKLVVTYTVANHSPDFFMFF